MTDRIALWLGAILILAVLADQTLNDGVATLFTLRRGYDLLQWITFWR